MEHFISIIYNESVDEQGLAECLASTNTVLNENEIEFYTGKVGNVKTIRMPLPEAIDNVEETAEVLAMRLFEFGLKKFEIELTEATLRRGSRGPEVKALQQQLGITADGIYGPNTEAAVRAFQQRAGIQVDGIAGGQTQSALAAGGSPRNAGAPRASTAPFTPGGGSTTQAPAQPQSAAPQTSPRPKARPAQPAAPTGGLDDTQARADIAQQRADQIAAAQRRRNPDATDPRGPDQRNVPSAGATQRPRGTGNATSGATAPGAQGDGLRGNAAVGAGPAQGTTVVGRPNVPVGELPAGEYTSRTVNNQDTARIGQQPDQTIDYTGGADANVGEPGQQGGVDTLRQQRADAQNQAADNRLIGIAQQQRDAQRAADRKAAIDALRGTADAEVVTTDDPTTSSGDGFDVSTLAMDTGQPPENQTTTGRTDAPSGEFTDRAVNMVRPEFPGQPQAEQPPQTQDNAANRSTQVAAQQQADFRARYNDDTSGRDGLPNEFVSQSLDPVLDNLSDAAAKNLIAAADGAPPAVARTIIRDIERTYGPAEQLKDMAREIAQEDPDQASALSRLSDFVASLNTGANETVSPRPKGAFMFRERNEWDAKYSATHNRDGSLKAKTNLIESRKYDEVTYHDDDQFYEDYGVMWYNDDNVIDEAEYQGRKVKLGKPMKGDVKKFKVYVRNPKGNVVKVNFGQKGVKIKKSNPARRRSFRARHNCDNPGPRHKARYWSCRKW